MLLVLTTIYEIYILVTNNKGIYHSIAVCKLTTETSCMCKKMFCCKWYKHYKIYPYMLEHTESFIFTSILMLACSLSEGIPGKTVEAPLFQLC